MLKFIERYADYTSAFDPETVHILVGAFDDAWSTLLTSGAPFSQADYKEAAREILAKRIIELAKGGERNQRRLTEAALLKLSTSKLIRKPREII